MFSLRTTIARRAPTAARAFIPARSIQSFRPLAAAKESSLNADGRGEEVEHHKQEQLRKQKQGTNEYKEELASDSEVALKADRGETKDAKKDIADLQKATAEAAQKNS
ncbi:hypothetical protein B0A48_09825 [Cryoendolithus antarcticus]|uniref:Uncharacterized protein n=1 Tax=Cryoendolithus antarcticus TaxID=1507870 RepID=A0A1V8T395_9PEZI|nr:hypothetical protein B0A48_09825 [Cryoendolithus antarcticus]